MVGLACRPTSETRKMEHAEINHIGERYIKTDIQRIQMVAGEQKQTFN